MFSQRAISEIKVEGDGKDLMKKALGTAQES